MSFLFPTRKPVRESYGHPNLDPIDPQDPGFRNLGIANRDLLGFDRIRSQELSVHLYRSNPIAYRAINIYKAFIAGNGFGIQSTNPDVQSCIDEFWGAPRNNLPRFHPWYVRDWLIFGESAHPVGEDELGFGNVTFGFIDPTTIERVDRMRDHNMILTTVHVRRGGTLHELEPLKIVAPNTNPLSDTAGLLEGQTFFWPLDRIAAATRGTPLLLPSIDWLDVYDQVLWEMLERQKAMRAFWWDATVDGDQQAVNKFLDEFGTTAPRTGSMRAHTDAIDIKAVNPSLNGYEDVNAARYQLRNVAVGLGLSPHQLGEPEDANRSTAEQMDKPVTMTMESIQNDWAMNLDELIKFVIDRKVAAGRLPAMVPEMRADGEPTGEEIEAREAFSIITPQINENDVEAAATSLATVAQAFTALDGLQAIGPEVISKVVRHLLPGLGIPADEIPEDDDLDGARATLDRFVDPEESAEIQAAINEGDTERLRELVTGVAA